MGLDRDRLAAFLGTYRGYDRDRLIGEGLLSTECPPKGADLIDPQFRSPQGESLLDLAKDMLYGLLFGDEATNTILRRNERELLTLTVPRPKPRPSIS